MSSGKRFLAIDYGDRRTGLAVSDPLGIIVQPLPIIDTTSLEELLEEIVRTVQEREIGTIVVGMPYRLDGSSGTRAEKTRKLIQDLQQRIPIPIVEWDERLTSAEAEEILRESGLNWKQRKGKVDKIAAVLILRSYLQSLKK